MKYKFIKDEKEIETDLEKWVWIAHYKDGSKLKQFDDDGFFHQFKEIEQDKIDIFEMKESQGNGRIFIDKEHGKDIFHFYRNIVLNNEEIRIRIYCFGMGELFIFILPNNEVVYAKDNVDILKLWQTVIG